MSRNSRVTFRSECHVTTRQASISWFCVWTLEECCMQFQIDQGCHVTLSFSYNWISISGDVASPGLLPRLDTDGFACLPTVLQSLNVSHFRVSVSLLRLDVCRTDSIRSSPLRGLWVKSVVQKWAWTNNSQSSDCKWVWRSGDECPNCSKTLYGPQCSSGHVVSVEFVRKQMTSQTKVVWS